MPESKPPAAAKAKAPRTVTVDYLTAASHPDAVVAGVLVAVIAALALTGGAGLIEPVVSLDLFSPDLESAPFLLTLGKIVVSVLALIAAGLGLAKHPRFPTLYLLVAVGLTLLIAADVGHWLSYRAPPGPFTVLGLLVVLAVPYVAFSRKCRLIFRRRIDVNELKSLTGSESWSASAAAAMAPALPSFDSSRQASASSKRPRAARRAGGGVSPPTAPALTVPKTPPRDTEAAALWNALYGAPQSGATDKPAVDTETDTPAGGGPSSKRHGLEALINLRPPGS